MRSLGVGVLSGALVLTGVLLLDMLGVQRTSFGTVPLEVFQVG